MSEEPTELPKIKWTCIYCNKPQETTSIPDFEGLPSYPDTIKKAAKNGHIACWDCFHRLVRQLHKRW